jgi:hypothetical protein
MTNGISGIGNSGFGGALSYPQETNSHPPFLVCFHPNLFILPIHPDSTLIQSVERIRTLQSLLLHPLVGALPEGERMIIKTEEEENRVPLQEEVSRERVRKRNSVEADGALLRPKEEEPNDPLSGCSPRADSRFLCLTNPGTAKSSERRALKTILCKEMAIEEYGNFTNDFAAFKRLFPRQLSERKAIGWYALLSGKVAKELANACFIACNSTKKKSTKLGCKSQKYNKTRTPEKHYKKWVQALFGGIGQYQLYLLIWAVEGLKGKDCAKILQDKVLVGGLKTSEEVHLKRVCIGQIRREVREFAALITDQDLKNLGNLKEATTEARMVALYEKYKDKCQLPYGYYFPLPGYAFSPEKSRLYWEIFTSTLSQGGLEHDLKEFFQELFDSEPVLGQLLFYLFNFADQYQVYEVREATQQDRSPSSTVNIDEMIAGLGRLCGTKVVDQHYFSTLHIWWKAHAKFRLSEKLLLITDDHPDLLSPHLKRFLSEYNILKNKLTKEHIESSATRLERVRRMTKRLSFIWESLRKLDVSTTLYEKSTI